MVEAAFIPWACVAAALVLMVLALPIVGVLTLAAGIGIIAKAK